jgi:hypothetical protein
MPRRIVMLALVVMILGSLSAPLAWETKETDSSGDWLSMYIRLGQRPVPGGIGFDNNEHAEMADLALQGLGLDVYTMSKGTAMYVVDLNASLVKRDRGLDQRDAEKYRGIDGAAKAYPDLEQRMLPPPPHFSGIPDFSYAIYDWINKNTLCPPLPKSANFYNICYGYFPGWLSALNSSHFGTQAEKNYRALHKTALWLAGRANLIRSALEKAPADLDAYGDFVREAERMALYYEATAQHFLQDRWSIGHMWDRWGTADYNALPVKEMVPNVTVGVIAGLIHGAQAVLVNPNIPLGAPEFVGVSIADPMSAPTMRGNPKVPVPVSWKRSAGTEKYPGVGDDRLEDMFRGYFGQNIPTMLKDYPLNVSVQRDTAMQCMQAGWLEVIRAFGAANGGYGIDGVPGPNNRPALDDTCFDAWATNESMYIGWHDNVDAGNLDLVTHIAVAFDPSGGAATAGGAIYVGLDRVDLKRLEMTLWKRAKVTPDGVDMAKTTELSNGSKVLARSGRVSGAAGYLEPENIDSLPMDDPKGRDRNTIWGFFNRAGAEHWCKRIASEPELLTSLRGSDDAVKQACCRYLADRAFTATDPKYAGRRREVRTLGGKSAAARLNAICAYYGLKSEKYDEKVPVYLHPGYVGAPYAVQPVMLPGAKSVQVDYASVANWCRKVPVLNLIADGSGRLSSQDLVADVVLKSDGKIPVEVAERRIGALLRDIDNRRESMQGRFYYADAIKRLDAAFRQYGSSEKAIRFYANSWGGFAGMVWSETGRVYYTEHAAFLRRSLDIIRTQGFATEGDLDYLESGMLAWKQFETYFETLFEAMFDTLGREGPLVDKEWAAGDRIWSFPADSAERAYWSAQAAGFRRQREVLDGAYAKLKGDIAEAAANRFFTAISERPAGTDGRKEITLTGLNLGPSTGDLWSTLSNSPLKVTSWSDTKIQFLLPDPLPKGTESESYELTVIRKDGTRSVGRFVMRLRR